MSLEQIIWTYHHTTWTVCEENKCYRNTWAHLSTRILLSLEILCTFQTMSLKISSICPPKKVFHWQCICHIWLWVATQYLARCSWRSQFPICTSLKLWTPWIPVTQWLTLISIMPQILMPVTHCWRAWQSPNSHHSIWNLSVHLWRQKEKAKMAF